jgi:hypothetical protein
MEGSACCCEGTTCARQGWQWFEGWLSPPVLGGQHTTPYGVAVCHRTNPTLALTQQADRRVSHKCPTGVPRASHGCPEPSGLRRPPYGDQLALLRSRTCGRRPLAMSTTVNPDSRGRAPARDVNDRLSRLARPRARSRRRRPSIPTRAALRPLATSTTVDHDLRGCAHARDVDDRRSRLARPRALSR